MNTEVITLVEDLQLRLQETEDDLEYFQGKCALLEEQLIKKEELNWLKLIFEDKSFIIVGQNKDDDVNIDYLNERYAYGFPLKTIKFIGTSH